jgi:hypothetical protein
LAVQDENDAADQRQEIEESLKKKVVSQIFASWNQMVSWLSQLQRLRRAG